MTDITDTVPLEGIDLSSHDAFVERVPHPTDRRGALARITDDGRRVVAAATARLNAEVFGELGLSAADCRRLTALLAKVRGASGDTTAG